MKANRGKVEIAMANCCMNIKDLQEITGMPRATINNVLKGKAVKPATIGKIAKALNVNVIEILEN